jgi:hypothetical protein
MSELNEDDMTFGSETGPKDEPLEGEIITGEPVGSPPTSRGNNTTRNVLIWAVVIILLLCCCCAALTAVIIASGLPEDLLRELNLTIAHSVIRFL